MGKAIGIDLGTTNSVAAYLDGDEPRILLNSYSEELTPSVVSLQRLDEQDQGDLVVGSSAVSQARAYPRDTIFSVKRLMGRPFHDDDVRRWKAKVSYEVIESQSPVQGMAAVVMGGKPYMPPDISAMILRNIKQAAEKILGDEVTHVVITVPAYFGEPERRATRDAGRLAGLVVKTLLPEPTAAALAFGTAVRLDGRSVLVYDLGGGTFDISILSIVERTDGTPSYNVLKTGGEHFLGGDDFDLVLVQMMLDDVRQKYDVDLSQDPQFIIVAKQAAEQAKKLLSHAETAPILIAQAARRGDKDIQIRMRVTRQDFESRISKMVDRARTMVLETLASQSLTPEDIDDVLMVGGATAVPLVTRSMEELFGKEKIRRNVNPMQCVALGAGILAGRMRGIECPSESCKHVCDESADSCPQCGASLGVAAAVVDEMTISQPTVKNFGIQVVKAGDRNAFEILIDKGTVLPMRESPRLKRFFTTAEGQQKIRLPIYEGLGASILQNTQIGTVEYELPHGLPVNHPVNISLQADRQSILKVTIEVQGYEIRHEQELRPDPSAGVRIIREEEEEILGGDDDVNAGEEALAALDRHVTFTEEFIGRYERVLTGHEKRRLEKAVEEGRRIYNDDQREAAARAVRALQRELDTCGTASLIEQGRLTAVAADAESSQELNDLADKMATAAEAGDTATMTALRASLASLIRKVAGQRSAVFVEAVNWDDLLSVTRMESRGDRPAPRRRP
jgi:molecular chaperone DnaK (HSP70)